MPLTHYMVQRHPELGYHVQAWVSSASLGIMCKLGYHLQIWVSYARYHVQGIICKRAVNNNNKISTFSKISFVSQRDFLLCLDYLLLVLFRYLFVILVLFINAIY